MTTWELFLAKKCFVQRKYAKEDQIKHIGGLLDLLKIVIISLKIENQVCFIMS